MCRRAGAARGAIPPAVDGTYEGTLVLATTSGAEKVPVTGRFRNSRGATTFTAAARALGGTLDASGEARGSVIRSLIANGTAIDLARLNANAGGQLQFQPECLRNAGPPHGIGEPRRRGPHLEGRARRAR